MKNNMKWMKRVMAMVLTLCMMLGSMSGYVPGWFAAFAEEGAAETAETPTEATDEGDTGESEGEQPAEEHAATSAPKEAPEQDEQPTGDEPTEQPKQDEQPAGDEPAEQPKQDEQPAGDEPAEQPKQDEQPAGDEPAEQPKQDEQPAGDEPAEQPKQDEQPAGDEPAEQPKQDEQPAGDEPAEQPKQDEQPAGDEPAEQPKQDEQPAGDEPAEQPKQDEQPAGDESAEPPKQDEQPAGDEPAEPPKDDEQPAGDEPAEQPKQDEQPAEEENNTKDADNKVEETPAGNKPSASGEGAEGGKADETAAPAETTDGSAGSEGETTSSALADTEPASAEGGADTGKEAPDEEESDTSDTADETPVENEPAPSGEADSDQEAAAAEDDETAADTPVEDKANTANSIEDTPAMEEAPEEDTAEEPAAASTEEDAVDDIPESTEELNVAAQANLVAAPKMLGVSTGAAANVVVPEASETEPQEDETAEVVEKAVFTMVVAPSMARGGDEAQNAEGDEADQYTGLQALITKALAKVTGTLTGRIKVLLASNTTYEGDVTISAGARKVADDFEMELSAEDAGDDGMDGEGASVIAGKLTIKGIKVIMNSVVMAAGNVIEVRNAGGEAGNQSNRGGELVYNGSKNLANEVNVVVGNNSSAEITTLGDNDKITATSEGGAKSLSINAGSGNNSVTANVAGGDVEIITGSGRDTVNLNANSSGRLGKVNVDTGDGNDTLNVMDNAPASSFTVNAGAGEDEITVDVRANAGDMTVNTGLGGDIITVLKGDHFSAENINYSQTATQYEQFRNEGTGATVSFVNGDEGAVDRFTIDVAAGGAIQKIDLSGGKGASVHLRGDLNPAFAQDADYKPITGTAGNIVLHVIPAQQSSFLGKTVDLTLGITSHATGTAKYNFTDALTGKRQVNIYAKPDRDKWYTYNIENPEDFTDYVLRTPIGELDGLVVNADRKTLLSNVLVDPTITGEGESIHVKNLTATNLNVLLKGAEINIEGTVKAQNVRAESVQGIATMGEAFGNLMHFVSREENDSSWDPEFKKMFEDLISLYDRARVNVAEGAKVEAEQDIVLLSRIKQFGKIMALIPDAFNVANVKVASAGVTVDGTLNALKGSVTADAKIETTTGYAPEFDKQGNVINVGKEGAQISANVIVDEASVVVGEKARITAAEDVLLNAQSKIGLHNYATFGSITAKMPVTLAATFIFNDVTNQVKGTVEAGRRAKVGAEGIIKDETSSKLGSSAKSGAINLFFSINWVNQDVQATIESGATVKAKRGDVAVQSLAIADVKTIATSEAPKDLAPASEWNGTINSVTALGEQMFGVIGGKIMAVLDKVGTTVGGWFTTKKKLQAAIAKIGKGNYTVKVIEPSAENAERGSATVSTMKRSELGDLRIMETDEELDQTVAIVKPVSKDGYTVKSVRYRYLEPGADHYTYKTVKEDFKHRYIFTVDRDNIEVIVTYRQLTDGEAVLFGLYKDSKAQPNGLKGLLNDAMDIAGGNDDYVPEMPDLFEGEGETHALRFINETAGGNILTWQTGDNDKSLTSVMSGQKVRLVPNPAAGKALQELKISYYASEYDFKEIRTADYIAPDANGNYYFTVPSDLLANAIVMVTAKFGDETEAEESTDPGKQIGGALALGVVSNDSSAIIYDNATVEAGGVLDMVGVKTTVNDILADGTAIEAGLGGVTAEQQVGETRQVVLSSWTAPNEVYQVPGAEYAVKLSSSLDGTITGNTKDGGATKAHPVITFKPEQAAKWEKIRVVVSYYTKFDYQIFTGTRLTSEILLDKDDVDIAADGTVTWKPSLMDYSVEPGTTMDISLVFLDANDTVLTSSGAGASSYIVKNPVNISYNALSTKESASESAAQTITRMGDLLAYENMLASQDRYYVRVTTEKGYKLDTAGVNDGTGIRKSNPDNLYATWMAGGQEYVVPLKQDAGANNAVWYFDAADPNIYLPEGAAVTIVAVFEEDKHDVVKADKAADANGNDIPKDQIDVSKAVAFNSSAAKAGDTVKVTVKAEGEWYPTGLVISYRGYDGTAAERVIADRTFTVTARDTDGRFVFEMPQLTDIDTASLKVTPIYAKKTIPVKAQGSSGATDTSEKSIVLSETSGKAYKGEQITVTPSAELIKAGYKVTGVTVKYGTETQTYDGRDSFTVPASNGFERESMRVSATLALKTVKIEDNTDVDGKGSMEAVSGRADVGEKVFIKIVPKPGYRLKIGTGRAVIKTSAGTQQVILKRDGQNRYFFIMPGDGVDKNTVVTLKGEFEEGSDASDTDMSLGMALAVGVTVADNTVEIRGGEATETQVSGNSNMTVTTPGANITTGRGIAMAAISEGGVASTVAKAGYNASNTGVAGAVAVQVATVDTDVRIGELAGIGVANGSITMISKGKQAFNVVADASGKKGANASSGSGVGVGIAVAVNSVDNRSILEDGVVLKTVGGTNAMPRLTGITINAAHKTKDIVTGKAGAAGGGSGIVPSAAVDVFNAETSAYLGRFDMKELKEAIGKKGPKLTEDEQAIKDGWLPVHGPVSVVATADSNRVQYNHEVSADASAAGGNSALGGAFAVTWISSIVNAKLNQSIRNNGNIDVIARGGDALKAVANASAAGGAKGTANGSNKKGSADLQADSLLKGAAKLGGKYAGNGMNGGEIMNDVAGRQKAETAESTVAGAGALVLNMQRNKVRAEVLDNVNLDSEGIVTIHASNRTDATIKANASATQSAVGVGVGIAINIVKMDNIARMGDGSVRAAGLQVIADVAEAPTKMRAITDVEGVTNYNTEFATKMTEAMRELLGDDVYEKVEPLVTGTSTFISTFYAKLIADLNLEELMNMSTDGLGGGFENAAKQMWDRLQNFPKALVAPLWDIMQQVGGTVDDWGDADQWKEKMLNILDSAWKTGLTQIGGDAVSVLKSTVMDSKGALASAAIDMVTNKIKGQPNPADKLKDVLKETFKNAFKKIFDTMINRVVTEASKELPFINASNVELVKSLKDKTTEQFMGSIVPYFTETFRKEVYDYEPLMTKIESQGLVDYLKEELRGLLKEATVAMTNEMIDKALGKLDVKFEREAIADRHIITTQAISGAGAKSTSGTGSLAIAVANLTTSAEIAPGANKLEITGYGDLTVNAEEARRIRTHSTAAVDENGEADNNEGAGDSESAATGGSADATETLISDDEMITIVTGAGGKAQFSKTDEGALYLIPDKGYKLAGATILRTYNRGDGNEIVDRLRPETYGRDYILYPTEGLDFDLMSEEEQRKLVISLDVQFEEDLREIPAVTLKDNKDNGNNDFVKQFKDAGKEIKYGVEGKEGASKVGKAKEGDLVEIIVPQVGKLTPYLVDVFDEEGNVIARYSVDTFMNPISDTMQTMTRASANYMETVLVFRMTDQKIGKVEFMFEEGVNNWDRQRARAEQEASQAAWNLAHMAVPTDRAGRKVGVGASFTLTYGNSDVEASIGRRDGGVSAGSVAVTASSDHEEENYSTAGTDPLEGVNIDAASSEKDFGLDASVSVNILDNDIRASIAEGMKVTTALNPNPPQDGRNAEAEKVSEDEPEAIQSTLGSVIVDATEIASSETKASAFATGSTTAVGASVAVNISLSDIKTKLGAEVDAAGKVVARSHSLSQDDTWSFASAMGANMQRTLNKVAKGAKTTAETANGLTTGSLYDKKAEDEEDKKKSTDTSRRITDRLNNDKVKSKDGDNASENLSVSTNVQRAMGSRFDAGQDANAEAGNGNSLVNEYGGQALASATGQQNRKSQAAATVGVTVALHDAAVEVNNRIKAGEGVSLTARNAGNFNTRATAAAMESGNLGFTNLGNTIAVAVGVSVNNNKATVDVYGDIDAKGDVQVGSDLTLNMTDNYRGKLAVQSISGSVSGSGANYSVAGAISTAVSHATSSAIIHGHERGANKSQASKVDGANVSVTARDKSRIALRAGGINASSGASVGMGMSSATIWSGNDVEAKLGEYIDVTADSFRLDARKEGVDFGDYKFPFGWRDLVSDTSDLDDEERENVYAGLFDVHRKPGKKSYEVDVNLNTYNLMKLADMMNFLSSTNYYVDAVAGSFMGKPLGLEGDSKLNLAGSVSIVRADNDVNAAVGKGATITTRKKAAENAVVVNAQNDNNTRLLGGAVQVASAKTSVGTTITFLSAADTVKASVGDFVTIDAGDISQKAHGDVSVQTFNAAASVNLSAEDSNTIGGSINVILLNNAVENKTGWMVDLISGNDIDIGANADMDLILATVSVSSALRKTAFGGSVNFVNDKTKARVNIGDDHRLRANQNINIGALASDKVITAIASASGSVDTGKGTAIAGSINVVNAGTKSTVQLGTNTWEDAFTAANGDVNITAHSSAGAINVTAAMAGSGKTAIGLSSNVNVFQREATVDILGGSDYRIKAGGNVQTAATGKDLTIMAGLAVAGSLGEGSSVSGNLPVVVSLNKVKTTLKDADIDAGGSVAVTSHLKDQAYMIAGSIALSNAGNAVGATAMTVVKRNTVKTDLGNNAVTAGSAKTVKLSHTGEDYRGIYVDARVRQTLIAGGAGVALSGASGVTGNVVTVVSDNDVKADASKAALKTTDPNLWKVKTVNLQWQLAKNNVSYTYTERKMSNLAPRIQRLLDGTYKKLGYKVDGTWYWVDKDDPNFDMLREYGGVTVKAENDSKQSVFAGGLGFGLTKGLGASVLTAVSENDVEALAHDVETDADVNVISNNDDKYIVLNINGGASTSTAAELAVTVTSLDSDSNAEVASKVTSRHGEFNLKANNKTDITNVSTAIAASAKYAATPVFVYTGFSGDTNARLKAGTVNVKKGVTVAVDSGKTVDQYTVGVAGSKDVSVSGGVSVVKIGDANNALVSAPVVVNAANMAVTANSDYTLRAANGVIGAAGKVGAAVNAMVSIVKGNTLAEMAGKATLKTGSLDVKASSRRDIINAALSLGAASTGGGAVGVMVLIAGDKMDQEAADQLAYGSTNSKANTTFNVGGVVRDLKRRGIDTSSMNGLSGDLQGNGKPLDTKTRGTYDAASGYSDGTDGENSTYTETDDVKRAKLIGTTAYSSDPQDSVIARIAETADITGGVNVKASQTTLADLYGAAIGAGSTFGGGISISVAKLRSNVLAVSTGRIDAVGRNVAVEAVSGTESAKADSSEQERSEALKMHLGSKLNPADRSIRAIGLAVGGSTTVGGAFAGGFVYMDNITSATLTGIVDRAGGIDVKAGSQYDNVLAATVAGAGGSYAGIAGSAAVAETNGIVSAVMGRNKVRANDGVFNTTGDAAVNVTTDAIMGANAVALAVGGGVAGVAVGVALATNNLTQDTTVEHSVNLNNANGQATLNLGATSVTTADSYLANAAGGLGGVGVGVSLVHVNPTVKTTLGDTAKQTYTNEATALTGYRAVNIKNDVSSAGESSLLSIASGVVGAGVNVMNVFNDTQATAKARNLEAALDEMTISGLLGGKGVSTAVATNGGIGGVGINVNYVDVDSKNVAALDVSDGNLTVNKLSVTAGDAEYSHKTHAESYSIATGIAGIEIGVNTSIARNRAVNDATITGRKTLNAGDVYLASYSHGTTDAKLVGVGLAGINIATSVVNALNEATSRARMDVNELNGDLAVRSDVQGETNAKLTTGTGSLIGVDTNVVTANGRTNALLDVTVRKGTGNKQSITTRVSGKDNVQTTINNLVGLNLGLSVATMVGGAHSKDVYDNKVTLKDGNYNLSSVSVSTDYDTYVNADVTPSSGGINLNLLDVSVNKANATNAAYAGSTLQLERAQAAVDVGVYVTTRGYSRAYASVKPALFDWNVSVGVGANKANAENRATQAAALKLADANVTRAANVNVQSVVTKGVASANVGGNAVDNNLKKNSKRVKMGAFTHDFNSAYAAQNVASTAMIQGDRLRNNSNTINAASLTVATLDQLTSESTARTDGAYTVGLTAAGSLKGEATTGAVHHAVLDKVKVKTTGAIDVYAKANTNATIHGGMPGSLSLAGGQYSEIGAGVGTKKNPQTAKVLIGAGVELDAGSKLTLDAWNEGSANASFSQGTRISLVEASDSKQPTDSWYDTGVVIGDGAKLTAGYKDFTVSNSGMLAQDIAWAALTIRSQAHANGSNKVDLSTAGVLVDSNHMKAEVNVHADSAITVGKGTQITATNGSVALYIDDYAKQDIRNVMDGGGVFAGDSGTAEAHITRNGIITLDKDVSISAPNSKVTLLSRSGKGDDLQLRTDVYSGGLITVSRSNTDIWLNSNNEIHLLEGVNILAGKDLTVKAVATSYGGAEKGGSGIYAYPRATSHGAYSDPSCWATITLNTTAYVNINRGGSRRVKLTSANGDVNVLANNEDMKVYSDPGAHGRGGVGGAAARTYYYLNMQDLIWIDAADFVARNNINILANEGLKASKSPDKKDHRPKIIADTVSHMYAGGGTVRATNVLQGKITIEIRTNDKNNVTFTAEKVVHEATHELNYDIEYTRHRSFLTTAKRGDNYWETGILTRCDFCGTYSKNKYYDGEGEIKTVGKNDASKALKSAMAKALAPLTDIQRQVDQVNNMVRARYGEEDYAAAGKIFVLEYPVVLTKDVTLDNEQINKYRLWNNPSANLDVYLLPNATRMYGNRRAGKIMLQYVAEVLRGDVRGDGEIHDIDIITALTERAFSHPVMPVGSTGSLDFATGVLTLPSLADFELYLHEVSANWLLGKIDEGFIRGMIADPDAANGAAINGEELPEGSIAEGLVPDGEEDSWKKYWLGDTPDTAADPNQTLIYLLVNEETDEVDAFRSSVNMIANGEEPVDVSLYLFRDSQADRVEEEKYNCMFFDTPEGEKSLVKVVTNVVGERDLDMPVPLRIVLRGFSLEGADLPVYSLTDHFFAMCDGTDGEVSMFDGFYTNTFDGDTFDSDYIRIEGILDGDLNITVKEGQSIWPEWTGENTAEDIAGNRYGQVGGEWYPEEEAPETTLPEDAVAA